jgi:hypothetical protein
MLAWSVLALSSTLVASAPSDAQESDFDHTESRFLLTGSHENVRCEACHIAGIFQGTPTDCAFCHDGTGMRAESGKPLDHVPTSNRCEDCHTSVTWEQVRFDHAAVTGSCSSCHNGFVARGKSNDHIFTNADCDLCHIEVVWYAIRFDHSAVMGSCSNCHNGIEATGLPNGHFGTGSQCDVCHTSNRWLPDTFRHMSGNYPGDHRDNLDCTQCHMANSEPVQWPFSSLQPDCAGCHRSDFKPGPHKKYENPDTPYTPEELRDCSGSCHTYTDSSLSTIKKRRDSEHRVSDGDF